MIENGIKEHAHLLRIFIQYKNENDDNLLIEWEELQTNRFGIQT